jgi:hypothetical protein
MGFLQPLALLGLAAAAIPPLLHLLTRRLPPTVVFPAVRYLAATEREHSHRLKLRNLLLMMLRMAIIVLLVLAAARPIVPTATGTAHPPTALGLVLDNSLSSSAVVGGQHVFETLRRRGRDIVARMTPDDELWLVLADDVPRRMGAADATSLLDTLSPWPVRLDVGDAVRAAARAVAAAPLEAAEVVVIGDQQATAFTAGEPGSVPVLVWRSPELPHNRAVDSASATPRNWIPDGRVTAAIGGDTGPPGAVRLVLGDRDLARDLAAPGDRIVLRARAPRGGWLSLRVELDPDELRLDDRWWLAVHSAEPAAVTAGDGAGLFVAQAVQVLQEGGRISRGTSVHLDDRLRPGTTILFPPADPVLRGAVNRALAARGSPWRLGEQMRGEWVVTGDLAPADSAAVFVRHRLIGAGTALATADGEPWVVRAGDVVIVASRMEQGWTDLPLRAGFVPFLDVLVNQVAARTSWVLRSEPGGVVSLPADVDAVAIGDQQPVPPDRRIAAPRDPGVYFLLGAGDTVGALEVNHDRRESSLTPADARTMRASLGDNARLLDGTTLHRDLFGGARRANLAGPLLLAALLAGVAELVVASIGARTREDV